jgi:hypothetical protein
MTMKNYNTNSQMNKVRLAFNLALIALCTGTTASQANEYLALDQAYKNIPSANAVSLIEQYSPVFDFTRNSCLPAAGISRSGRKNGGLDDSGTITGDCRSGIPKGFLRLSNTYHRWVSQVDNGNEYSAHLYELYFEKDMAVNYSSWPGHRHDVETAIIYFTNQVPTHIAISAHGDYTRKSWDKVKKEGTHPKVVYYKSSVIPYGGTHSFTFSDSYDLIAQYPPKYKVQNPDGYWVQPTIVSWYEMSGDNVDNASMRNKFNSWSFGSAAFKFKDAGSRFINEVNKSDARPSGYPEFTQQSVDMAQWGDIPAITTAVPVLLNN